MTDCRPCRSETTAGHNGAENTPKETPVITEEEARMIGRAIREAAGLIQVPLENEIERRAFCLKSAIETRGSAFPTDSKATEDAADVLQAARMYDDFLSGRGPAENTPPSTTNRRTPC